MKIKQLPLLAVPGVGVENIGLSEISLNGKMVNYAANMLYYNDLQKWDILFSFKLF